MSDYRFYFVDTDGYIAGPPFIADLVSDEAAEAHASVVFKSLFDIEIWNGTRCVGLVRRASRPNAGAASELQPEYADA
jgi:hypothetical protein